MKITTGIPHLKIPDLTSVIAFVRHDGLTSCYFCNTQKLSYFLLPSFVLLLVLWFNFLLFYHKYSQMSSFMRSAVSFPRTVTNVTIQHLYTGRLIMFSMITNIYNKKTKGPTWMELFTATGKLKKFFFLTARDVRCVHHRWHGTHIQVVATHASPCRRVCGSNLNIVSMCAVSPVLHTSNISSCQKELFQFSCGCEQFH